MRYLNKSVFAAGKVYPEGTEATRELEDLITNPAHWAGPSRGDVRAAADQDRKDDRAAERAAQKEAAEQAAAEAAENAALEVLAALTPEERAAIAELVAAGDSNTNGAQGS